MIRRLPLGLVLACAAAPLPAQLPYLTAPTGTLRIELGGVFEPTSAEFADGRRRDFGDPIGAAALTAATSPLVRDLESRLGAVLGRASSGHTLGALNADAMLQRGTGVIGLAAGITERLTAVVRIPIVSVRTEARVTSDPTGATLGLNPALLGDQTSDQFLTRFDAALAELAARIAAGDYAGSPDLEALANQTLSEGSALRTSLGALLVGDGASPVLPTASSGDGADLLAQVTTVRDRFGGALGIPGFTGTPGLPAEPITSAGFEQLLDAPGGFDLAPFDQQPLVGLGDVELGLVAMVAGGATAERRSWFGLWVSGGVTLPTGTPPDPTFLRDGGTGDGQLDLNLGATVDVGRGRLGVRGNVQYQRQFAGEREARVGARDEFLLPAYRQALLDWDPGDVLHVSATPYLRLADRLAITGNAAWFSRGEDRWSLSDSAAVIGTATTEGMATGTSATGLRLGLGMSYAHAGTTRSGETRMPVEAGIAIERTVSSGSGLVPAPLTTRVWFRVYKRLW